jgi:DNA-binding NtrC family response regulator
MIATATEPREFSRPVEKFPALRVLVVDDEPLIRWCLAETLTNSGYQVVESADATSARSAIRDASHAFDVVLLDLRLPDSEDLSLVRAIRHAAPRAQIILMTAFGSPEIVDCARRLGAFRVVSKPFEIDEMADLVAQAAATPQSA